MNTRFFSTVLVSSFLCVAPLHAEEKPAEPSLPAATAPATTWDKNGILSADDIIASLGIKPTPEQLRAISDAVQKRNAALTLANQRFSEELHATLKTTDTELAARLQDEKERRRLERIRIYQPSRYQALKSKKK